MNALRKALADYFAVRRALGFKLYRAEKLLGQFLTFVEAAQCLPGSELRIMLSPVARRRR